MEKVKIYTEDEFTEGLSTAFIAGQRGVSWDIFKEHYPQKLSPLSESGKSKVSAEAVLDSHLGHWFSNVNHEFEGEIKAVRNNVLKCMEEYASQFAAQSQQELGETVSREEYEKAIDQIGKLQKELDKADEYIQNLHNGTEH